MAIDYNKYINSKGTHYISNSGGDERGKITGGAAGDQTGKEWQLKAWYNRPWTHVLRHPDTKVRRLIAELAIEAALNNKIGYDQNQRGTFWTQLKASGYRPANIQTKCEADCSAGANSIVKAVGYLLGIDALKNVSSANSSRNTRSGLKAAGFEVLTASKYLTGHTYLLPGDILLYENHHVATNITRGSKATGEVADHVDTGSGTTSPNGTTGYKLGDRILKNGMSGSDVKDLQKLLIAQGYSCGPDGADGDYGDNTEKAVRGFQHAKGLTVDGEAGPNTIAVLQAASGSATSSTPAPTTAKRVTISNCKECNIRLGPGDTFGIVGTAKSGDSFEAIDGWVPVKIEGVVRWISAKYAEVK